MEAKRHMETKRHREWHDLAQRIDGGLDVTLLWNEVTNDLSVLVADERSGDFFGIEVTQAGDALDVYRHPFAYAAARGIAYRLSNPADRVVADLDVADLDAADRDVADVDGADLDGADPDAAWPSVSTSSRDGSSDAGQMTGSGADDMRGLIADAGTGLGGNPQALPFLIPQDSLALVVAVSTIAFEHAARSWLRWWLS
jgi:hypothetical protein